MHKTAVRVMNGFFMAMILVFAVTANSCAKQSMVIVQNLRCENRVDPLGVDVRSPRFSWELGSTERNQAQTARQIQLATSAALLEEDRPDVWDSGKMESPQSVLVPYGGEGFAQGGAQVRAKDLESGTEYFWRVRIWDKHGRRSSWSEAAAFVTGPADTEGWSGARWIAYEELPENLRLVPGVHGSGDALGEVAVRRPVVPLFRKEFDAPDDIRKAYVFVSGLGHYELHLNGEKVGDAFLSPGWTNYQKTCLYNVYDVTPHLKKGHNAFGVLVGNGFFNVNRERYRKLVIAYGMPMMILKLQIEYASGKKEVVVSGPDWKTEKSAITYTSIYGGEDYDARLEQPGWDNPGFDDSRWKPALAVAGPGGGLRAERDYPLRVMQEFAAVKVNEPKKGVFIYDFGQNASGILRLMVKGEKGQTVKMIPGELLGPDSCVTQKASGEPFYFAYTMKGQGEEEWTPRFTYYGFRYVQVEGAVPGELHHPRIGQQATNTQSEKPLPATSGAQEGMPAVKVDSSSQIMASSSDNLPAIIDLRLLHTRNSSPPSGAFACSNDLFEKAYELINWAIKSNLASVPTDCPHREKLGWLEQTYLMGGSIHFNFDIYNLYRRLVADMIEAQLENGLVPDIAPEFVPFEGGFRDSPEWGSASVILPWLLYRWYGDLDVVERAYPMMKKYVEYLDSKAQAGILSHGLGDWFDLGPNPPGPSQLTPLPLTATAVYYYDLTLLARMAGLLGRDGDAAAFKEKAEAVKAAFNNKFFNPETLVYATGSQTSYSMPLCFGMVEERYRKPVFDNLVRSIRDGGNALTAGDVGFHYLVKALEEGGASDLVFEMNSRSDVPGYGYQLAKGATALTESWPAREDVSNNHMMLGHIMEWFYSGLAGIGQAEDSTGFEKIIIAPNPVGDITWVKAAFRSPRGEIGSHWMRDGSRFALEIGIPVNSRATVLLPAQGLEVVEIAGLREGNKEAPGKTAEAQRRGGKNRLLGGVKILGMKNGRAVIEIGSGRYRFTSVLSRG